MIQMTQQTSISNFQQQSFAYRIFQLIVLPVILLFITSSLSQILAQTAQPQAPTLEVGKPFTHEMSGTGVHSYQISIEADRYLRVVVEQRGINVCVTLIAPNGEKLIEADNPHGTNMPETLETIVQVAGVYRLEVSSENQSTAGSYIIKIEELRPATQQDKITLDAKTQTREMFLLDINAINGSQQIIEKGEKIVKLWQAIGDKRSEANVFTYIGRSYHLLGDVKKAIDCYSRALQLQEETKEIGGQIMSLNNLSIAYRELGEPQKSLKLLEKAMAINRERGKPQGDVITLFSLSVIYGDMGESQTAINYLRETAEQYRKSNNPGGEARMIGQMGTIYEKLGDKQKALECYQQTLSFMQATNARVFYVYQQRIGRIYSALGERQKALEYLNKALTESRKAGGKTTEAETLDDLGVIFGEMGDVERARESFVQSLAISRTLEDKITESSALYHSARLERNLGELKKAKNAIEESIAIIESLRAKVGVPNLLASYFESAQSYYELAIDILFRLHQTRPSEGFDKQALQMSERARARALLESLTEAKINLREGVDSALLEREKLLQQALNARAMRLARLILKQAEQAAMLQKELEELRAEYQRLQAEIRVSSPRYAALTQPIPLNLNEIQTQILDKDTVLLEYALGENRSFLFVVTTDSIQTFELAKREVIEKAAREVYELLTARNKTIKFETQDEKLDRVAQADAEFPEAANKLVQLILAPASKALTKKRLLIVPDGALQYIPFAALPVAGSQLSVVNSEPTNNRQQGAVNGQPLIFNHEIVTLPSASTLAILRKETGARTPAQKTIAVLADPVFEADDDRFKAATVKMKHASSASSEPVAKVRSAETTDFSHFTRAVKEAENADVGFQFSRLPFTRKEAQAINKFVPVSQNMTALDFSANRSIALSPELSKYRIIHFATHGFVSTAHPELSGIVLSLLDEQGKPQDGFLRAGDIYNLSLPADLVVLSGCRTGLGKEIRGEGLVGLTRGFMYAGAARVAVSLWDVHDEATAELMTRFYKGMLGKDKLSPATALRQAQTSMMKEKRWSAPYYWSGFILQGEPR